MIKRTDSEWIRLFEQHQQSGQTAAAFCRKHKLCSKYFSLRKKQLGWTDTRQRTGKAELASFVRAVTHPVEAITIRLGEVTLKMPSSVDPHWLASVIERLR